MQGWKRGGGLMRPVCRRWPFAEPASSDSAALLSGMPDLTPTSPRGGDHATFRLIRCLGWIRFARGEMERQDLPVTFHSVFRADFLQACEHLSCGGVQIHSRPEAMRPVEAGYPSAPWPAPGWTQAPSHGRAERGKYSLDLLLRATVPPRWMRGQRCADHIAGWEGCPGVRGTTPTFFAVSWPG